MTPDDMQAEQDAYSQQYDSQQAQKAQADAQAKQEPSFLQKWITSPGSITGTMIDGAISTADSMFNSEAGKKVRDVVAGAATGAANIGDAAHSVEESIADPFDVKDVPSPIWDHAKGAIMDFRDAVAVKDPTLADSLVQGVGQLAIPFAGYSRGLSMLHGVAHMVAASALTDATALAPHDMRMADLIALGKHTEGKLGSALNTLAPDGTAINAYINYLTDRGNESEAEGRFKNVLDGFGANLIATPLMMAAGSVLKQGYAGLRYMVENGGRTLKDIAPVKAANAPGVEDPRITQLKQEAANVENEQPSVGSGMTRLWRGNRVAGDEGNPSYTDDLSGIALPFQKAYGGKLSFVDVPTNQLSGMRASATGGRTSAEYTVPDDFTRLARYAASGGKPIAHVIEDPNIAGMKTKLREVAVKNNAAGEK